MINQVEGGWSSRKKFTVGGTLGAIASLVTIVSFVNGPSSPPQPGPTPGHLSPRLSLQGHLGVPGQYR